MKRIAFLTTMVMCFAAGLLWAQGGPPGGGGKGGFGGPPTPKRQLGQTFRAVGKLQKKPLSKDQAAQMLAVLSPWRTKPKMNDDEAKEVSKKLKPVFSVDQLNELDSARDGGFGKGGPGGGGPGGPGGGGDEATRAKMMDYFQKRGELAKDDNPLNVKLAESRMKEGSAAFAKAFPEMAKDSGDRAARGQRRLEDLKKVWQMLDATAKGGAAPAKGEAKKAAPATKAPAKTAASKEPARKS